MIKQYYINQTIEAMQYDGTNFQEVLDFVGPIQQYKVGALAYFQWIVKTLDNRILILPNDLFHQLYTQVFD